MNIDLRQKEVETEDSQLQKVDMNLIDVFPSVCKIVFQNRKGTGFLIKIQQINKILFCLMTNEHVVKKEMIEAREIIHVCYNFEKTKSNINLNTSERFIQYNSNLDITIIEILPKDNINNDYFLLPYTDNINNLKNERIYIPQFPKGELAYSKGYIKEINEYELIHTAATLPGSSGSPIFLENSKKVVGMHKEGSLFKMENYGSFLYPIIHSLQKDIIINNIKEENNKYVWVNEDYYIGPLLNGLPNGKGKQFNKNGHLIYEGYFVNGIRIGFGKFIYLSGNYYIGQFLNNVSYGNGKQYYKNGNIMYQGNFANGKREGFGKYFFEDGSCYIGQFLNNFANGKGKQYNKNGKLIYEGDFVNNKRQGYGKYIYDNGNYYIGQFLNNVAYGKGMQFDINGNIIYEGNFINGKREEQF